MKVCSKCKVEKPLADYYKNPANKNGYDSGCKVCKEAVRRANPLCKLRERKNRLVSNYKMTIEDFNKMWADQGGKCRICENELEVGINTHVDHDHSCCPDTKTCGKCIRGLLCRACNCTLGFIEIRGVSPAKFQAYMDNNKATNGD